MKAVRAQETTAELEHLAAIAQRAGLDTRAVAGPEHHNVILNSRRFHYVEWGEPSRPPILFLHGGNQSARTWDVVCLALKDRFRCIALDQRGHGDSEWSYEQDYAPASQAADIKALSDKLGLSWFVIVGMSMGCLTGLHYASAHCGTLAGFVAVDAGPYVQTTGAEEIRRFVEDNTVHASFEDFVRVATGFNPRREAQFLRYSLHHTVRQLADGSWTWRADRRRSLTLPQMIQMASVLEHALKEIVCPVLVMRGGESPVLSAEDFERFVGGLPRGRGVVVPNAGHTVQGDNPRALIAALEEFLASLPPPFGSDPNAAAAHQGSADGTVSVGPKTPAA